MAVSLKLSMETVFMITIPRIQTSRLRFTPKTSTRTSKHLAHDYEIWVLFTIKYPKEMLASKIGTEEENWIRFFGSPYLQVVSMTKSIEHIKFRTDIYTFDETAFLW